MTGGAPVKENNTGTHASAIIAVQITELKCFGEGPLLVFRSTLCLKWGCH